MATIDDARRIIVELESKAHALGYMLALYGSVLTKGAGRDIDIFAVPWRPASPTLLVDLFRLHGCVPQGEPYRSAMNTMAVQFIGAGDLVIDLQIREVPQLSRFSA